MRTGSPRTCSALCSLRCERKARTPLSLNKTAPARSPKPELARLTAHSAGDRPLPLGAEEHTLALVDYHEYRPVFLFRTNADMLTCVCVR